MQSKAQSPERTHPIKNGTLTDMDPDMSLDDLEVKSFFLLMATVMAILPNLLIIRNLLRNPIALLVLLNLSVAALNYLPNIESIPYIEDWKRAVWKMNIAVFQVSMGLSRLFVLVLSVAASASKEVLIWTLALLLTLLSLLEDFVMEQYRWVSAALKEFRDQFRGCCNAKERILYLAS